MGHGHGHGHGPAPADPRDRSRHRNRLALAFGITLTYFVVEAIFAVLTGSLTLLADAGHMLTDTLGLGLALAAITVAARSNRSAAHTFGLHRLEILAALANAALLLLVAGYVLFHAIARFGDPVDLPTHQLFVVAIIGLAANLACFAMLREGAKENINVRGAYLEVVADALGSAAVLIAAVLIVFTGWGWVDPAFALALAAFIVPRTLRLAGHALRVLLQMAPRGVSIPAVRADLAGLDGVAAVDDLHVWTLSSGMDVATAHLRLSGDLSSDEVLRAAQELLAHSYGLVHSTLQVECSDGVADLDARWCEAARDRAPDTLGVDLAPPLPVDAVPSPRGRHRRAAN
ncbi:MAG: cation diffusion facilitator family transporter [Sporichthyaceae bacterium]